MRKKINTILILLALLSVTVCAVSYIIRYSQVSDVYLRYSDRDDLRVAFVKGYRLDDSTVVDVTTLAAVDSASWENLLREMNFKNETINELVNAVNNGESVVTEYYCQRNHPEHIVAVNECSDYSLVFFSFNERKTFVFDIESAKQGRRIIAYKNNEILK